jgi:hypothetical protein
LQQPVLAHVYGVRERKQAGSGGACLRMCTPRRRSGARRGAASVTGCAAAPRRAWDRLRAHRGSADAGGASCSAATATPPTSTRPRSSGISAARTRRRDLVRTTGAAGRELFGVCVFSR